ncbi:MAG: hypothetical protein VYB65_10445 [Myxococcota bacterium]|nr:hypothetical protein [Myxococcota bacterium]
MKTTLYDNNVSAYLHQVMNDVVGKPDFGEHWDADKVIDVDQVPEAYRGVVKQAAGEAKSLRAADLEKALWEGHDALLSEDKSFGVHTSPYSFARNFGIGGDGILDTGEQRKASAKSPMALQLIEFIQSERGE